MKNYMFDTNIFNEILDKRIDITPITNVLFYVTHIQKNEIQTTKQDERRGELLNVFHEVQKSVIATESAVWDLSEWDNAKLGTEEGLYQQITERLGELNKKKKNNSQDALIAETAISNGQILVTNDKDLRTVVNEFDGRAIGLDEFLSNKVLPVARSR